MAAAWPSLAAGGRTAATTPQVNRGKGKPPDGLGHGTVQLEPSCTVASGPFFLFFFFLFYFFSVLANCLGTK